MDTTSNYNLPLPHPEAISAKADVQKIRDALILLDGALADAGVDAYTKLESDGAIATAKNEAIADAVAQAKADLLGGAPEAALDTLTELANALNGDGLIWIALSKLKRGVSIVAFLSNLVKL